MKYPIRLLFAEAAVIEDPAAAGSGNVPAAEAVIEAPAIIERPAHIPEKFWTDGTVDTEGLLKSYTHLESKVGGGKLNVADIPDDPAGYELKPEKLPDGVTWSEDAATRFAGLFHENGIPKTAAKAVVENFLTMEAENQAKVAQAYEAQLAADQTALEAEWGGGKKYQARKEEVTKKVQALGYDVHDPLLFSNPRVVSLLGKVVGLLSEDSIAALPGSVAPGNSFVKGSEEAQKIMRDPSHPEHAAYMQGDRTVIAKVARLIDG